MSLADLDPHLSVPKRLAAIGLLSAAREVEFSYLKEQLQLGDSDLSKQLKVLTEAGYATSRRTGKGKTRASWFSITSAGERALKAHAAALQALLAPTVPEAAPPEAARPETGPISPAKSPAQT